ncbi:MAG: iron dicitrate transport regulator FecR, partial [Xanthobacteraceae bacterium]
LTQGASAFQLRAGPGGRMSAVPYRIPPQEAARDRGRLQRLNMAHTLGRRMMEQRRLNRQRPNNQRPGRPNFRGPPNGRPRGHGQPRRGGLRDNRNRQ